MNSSPSPYLNVTRLQSITRGHEEHLLVLDVDALDGADSLGEVEDLGLGERLGREPAAALLPDHGRVEALLDRRPDRERGGEVVALDDEVGAVADPDLVDLREQLVGRVAREHVGGAGLDPDPDQRQPAGLLPALVLRELVVAELHARLGVGPLGMRLRERRCHVEIGRPGLEAGVEDLRVEPRVGGVQHGVGLRLPDQRDDRLLARGVDRGRLEPVGLAEPVDDRLGPGDVEIRKRDAVEERAALRDCGEGRADAAGSDHEDSHTRVLPDRAVRNRWRCPRLMPLGVGPATIEQEDERERVRSDQSGDGRAGRGVPDDQRRRTRGRRRGG